MFLFMKQMFPTRRLVRRQHKSIPDRNGDTVIRVGASLRKLRASMGLRVEDLARRAGFTKGFISKVETGKSSPPIATLMRLAEALGVEPAVLFHSKSMQATADPDATVHVPPGARQRVQNAGAGPGYSYWALAAARGHKSMEPFLLTVRPRDVDPKKTFEHPGEEFIFVLKGRADYRVGEELFHLQAGDSLYFDARRPHAPYPKGGPVTFLAIFCAPPRPVRERPARR
jgi:transcriptional regulator with XRE-family HTH domain